jgi:glyoxylase-like metal-dependent hydrolase (beta-lactamase superfamily II)
MATQNRRQFLTTLGVAGAGVAAAGMWQGANARPVRAQGGMMGAVSILKKGGLTLHTYVAPEASALVTTHIIETANSLVVVDTQFLQTFSKEARAYIDSLGKKIERVILSHQHPDHWFGANNFADVPFVSTAAAAAAIKADIEAGVVQQRAAQLGEAEVPATPRAPEGSVVEGQETIDGVQFGYKIYKNAEAPEQLVIELPQARALIVQDLVFNNTYFFPVADLPGWVTVLETLRGQKADFDTLLCGHGLPTSLGEVDAAIEHVKFMQETFATAKTAEEATAAIVAKYPTYGAAVVLTFIPLVYQNR